MKGKKEYLILVLVIAGLAIYLFSQKKGEVHYTLPDVPALDEKSVTRLTISKGERNITVGLKDGVWRLEPEGFPADTTLVDEMIQKVGQLRLTALASESQNYAIYQLDDAAKVGLVLGDGATDLRQIYIGKRAPSSRHTFVQMEHDPRVFHADGDLVSLFDKTVADLRDKVVMRIEDDIGEIAFETAGGSVTLVKSTSGTPVDDTHRSQNTGAEAPEAKTLWQRETGEIVDERQVEGLLTHLKNLRCDRFVDGKAKTDLVDPAYSISLTGTKPYHLSIFPPPPEDETKKGYRAISSESNYPFILPNWKAEQIMKAVDAIAQAQPEDH